MINNVLVAKDPRARIAILLPLLAYLFWATESFFAPPNIVWAALLLLPAILMMFVSWLLLQGKADGALSFIEVNARRIAILLIVSVAAIYILINLIQWRFFAFGAYPEDLAYTNQVLWNTIHGDFLRGDLQQTRIYDPPVSNDLALHVSPVLLGLLLPVYALVPHFLTLQIVQSLALAGAAWPLFLLTRDLLGGVAAIVAMFLYLFNPATLSQGFGSFTLLPLAPLPFFWALRWYLKEDLGRFMIWMTACLCVREELAITAVGFGLMALVSRRKWQWILPVFAVAVSWWFITTLVVQPAFGRVGNSALDMGLSGGQGSPAGMYRVLLADPAWVFEALAKGGGDCLYRLFRSVGFMALAGRDGVIAAPQLLSNLFLGRAHFSGGDPFSRFALVASCALVGSAVINVKRVTGRFRVDAKVFPVLLLAVLPSISLLDGAKDVTRERLISYFVGNDAAALRKGLALIPSEASVAAPVYVLPVISARKNVYTVEYLSMYPKSDIEYFLMDKKFDRVTTNPKLLENYMSLLETLTSSDVYEVKWRSGDYILFSVKKHK